MLRSAEQSPQEEPALDGASAADFDPTDCWNDEDIAQVVRCMPAVMCRMWKFMWCLFSDVDAAYHGTQLSIA